MKDHLTIELLGDGKLPIAAGQTILDAALAATGIVPGNLLSHTCPFYPGALQVAGVWCPGLESNLKYKRMRNVYQSTWGKSSRVILVSF
ncbi:MAG TPA: hypothetical protein VEY10_09130 [Flavisolibacter sp.]|nr:hypothetical protein [Flavisolibacter sp.]